MTLFRKKTIKGDPHAEYQTTIRFLDDSEPTILTFKKDTLGQVLFDQVCEKLNLLEKDYFGLRYVDSEKQRHWLDPLKSVYRQLKGVNPLVLCFRVKFYPAEPSKLHEEITRYYLFLQLRRDLHHGRLLCSQSDANLLAAYILQSEIGDYDPEEHPVGYVSEFKMLPKQNARTEEQIMELHKTLAGQNPAEAEANFLKKACTLDTYGVDPHQVKDQKSQNLYLGVTHQGIMTFLGNRRTQLYKWNQIKKIAFEGKMFIVHVNVTEDEDATNNKKEHIIVLKKQKKQQPIGYKCATVGACKYLWRCAVEQQLFFTLNDSSHTPKVRSGGSFFSRGSKFRFSGRCQNEAYLASDDIKRNEPTFTRSSSLPNFARKSDSKNSIRPSSLMKEMVKEDKAKKKYNESPVDVQDLEKKAEVKTLQRGPVLAAPLAAEESIALENAGSAQASAPNGPSLTPEIKINGTVVTGVSSLDDSILPYEPEQTILEDPPVEKHVSSYSGEETPDEERTKMSLDEQLNHLEEELKKMETQTKSNHIVEQEVTAEEVCSNNVQANHVDHGENHAKEKVVSPSVSSGVSCCKVFMFTFFFLFLTLAVVLVVILNSDLEHPWLDELRQQVKYIDPMRDYVTHTIEQLFQS